MFSTKRFLGLSAALVTLGIAVTTAFAHVIVLPRESRAGANQEYTMRVPTEKNSATVQIEAEFPADVEISSLDQKAGWKIELRKDGSGKIVGAVWSGSSIPPREVAEFHFAARNPNSDTRLVWRVTQFYEDGSKSEWTGPEGSHSPAPSTLIKQQQAAK